MSTIFGVDMNTLMSLLLEALAAAPAVAKNFEADAQAWHDGHGWQEKTIAAAATAGTLAQVLTAVAGKPAQPGE
jgi:hypothetical protein